MKPSQIAYKTLDSLYAATESNDRANRGVKVKGWLIAAAFSAIVWGLLYLAVKSF